MFRHSLVTRLAIAVGFILTAIFTHYVAMSKTNYAMNYAVAAFIDANIAVMLFAFGNSSLVRDLAKINFLSVVCHAVGFILFISGIPSIAYVIFAYAVLAIQWIRLIIVMPADGDTNIRDFRLDMVLRAYLDSRAASSEKGKRCH